MKKPRNWPLIVCVVIGIVVVQLLAPILNPFIFDPFLRAFPGGAPETAAQDARLLAGGVTGVAKFALGFLLGFGAYKIFFKARA